MNTTRFHLGALTGAALFICTSCSGPQGKVAETTICDMVAIIGGVPGEMVCRDIADLFTDDSSPADGGVSSDAGADAGVLGLAKPTCNLVPLKVKGRDPRERVCDWRLPSIYKKLKIQPGN